MSILDQQGALQILEAAKETEYYALFYFLLHTGCRRSEALAVRWADLDLTLGQVSIKRSLHCLKGGALVYRPPKTGKVPPIGHPYPVSGPGVAGTPPGLRGAVEGAGSTAGRRRAGLLSR